MNALSAVLADVGDYAVAFFESFSRCYFRDALKNMRYNRAVFLGDLVCRAYVALWNNENVYGCLRVDVAEGKDAFILINLCGGDISRYDLTKNTIHIVTDPFMCFASI